VDHDQLQDDLLLLRAVRCDRLRLRLVRFGRATAVDGGTLLLRQHVRLRDLHLPAELRLRVVTEAEGSGGPA
jgi:hypothetical protein